MKTFVKVLWVLSGIILTLSGVYCLFKPAVTLLSLSFMIGFVILFNGITAFSHYFIERDFPGSGWLLFDGILGTVFGILLLFTNMSSYLAIFLPIFFSIWIVIFGIFKICNSIDVKKLGEKNWYMMTIIGILCVILGIAMWIKPIISAFAISLIIGIYLIIAGVSTLTAFYFVNKINKLQ